MYLIVYETVLREQRNDGLCSDLLFLWFVQPNVFTAGAVPTHGNELLFTMNRVFMTEDSAQFLITFWTEMVITILIGFSSNGVHKSVRCDSVDKVTLGAFPRYWNPFPFSIYGLVSVKSYSLTATFWTFFPQTGSPPEKS